MNRGLESEVWYNRQELFGGNGGEWDKMVFGDHHFVVVRGR